MIHIIKENTKMKNTANISLPPIKGCGKNSIYCQDFCYAKKFYRMYPEVTKAWDENLKELITNREFYFQSIRRYLLNKRPLYFRWHISGDILDQAYLNQMNIIANDYYFINFLVFTKQYHLNFSSKAKNLSIILSACPGLELPKINLPIAFINFPKEERYNQIFICPENCESCRMCWTSKSDILLSIKRS